MATQKLVKGDGDGQLVRPPVAKCVSIAARGVTTDRDFASLMSAIMGDLAQGALAPEVGNAMVNAGGKLLKVVEMRLRYGTKDGEGKSLKLVD